MALTVDVAAKRAVALRSPDTVMRLERMGSFFPSRLSFIPTLMRRLRAEGWRIALAENGLDRDGYGHLVYRADGPRKTYALVGFSTPLADEARSDRVIAEAWDASFVLYDGMPDAAEIARLASAAPRQEAARYTARDLVLSRANRSVRFFDHVVTRLSEGRQPDADLVASVGYLMRTTAVYGNGKFGIADRADVLARGDLTGPFEAEMLTVYLIRAFTLDLVDHIARHRAPETAVALDPEIRRRLGVGNSTGLGMAPFLVTHPTLLNNWIMARETALQRVRAIPTPDRDHLERFREVLADARRHAAEWSVDDPRQMVRIEELRADLHRIERWISSVDILHAPYPWDVIVNLAEETVGIEAQECLVSLLIEPYGDLVDGFTHCMGAGPEPAFDPRATVAELRRILSDAYRWTDRVDLDDPRERALFWYVSQEKKEPRLGNRFEEAGADKEFPFGIVEGVRRLAGALETFPDGALAAEVALAHPDLRHVIRRVEIAGRHPFAEIRDNLVGIDCLPIDLLRCKLSFFGACRFDPRSDRWTRITLFAGAPLPESLDGEEAGRWHVLAPLARP